MGLAAVETVDAAYLKLWVVLRDYDHNDSASDYRTARVLFGGARFTF